MTHFIHELMAVLSFDVMFNGVSSYLSHFVSLFLLDFVSSGPPSFNRTLEVSPLNFSAKLHHSWTR